MEAGDAVRHVYNSKMVGKIVEVKDKQIAVDWGDRKPLTHPARFIRLDTADFKTEEGPTCGPVSQVHNNQYGVRLRKDPSLYGMPKSQDREEEFEIETTDVIEKDSEAEGVEASTETEVMEQEEIENA